MESISEAFNKCFVADFIFSVSRTIEDKNTNAGRIFIAKNRNGPDGLIYNIFMDTSCVKIRVLKEDTDSIGDINENAAKKQMENLREKYQSFKKNLNKKGEKTNGTSE